MRQVQGFADCNCLEFSGAIMTPAGFGRYDSADVNECGNSNRYILSCDTSVTPKRWKLSAITSVCVAQYEWTPQPGSSCSPFQLVFRLRTYALNIQGGYPNCGNCAPKHTNDGDIVLEATIVENV